MDEKTLDDIKEEEDVPTVKIQKENEKPAPSFDYDDYSPSDNEILEIEKEMQENIEKRTKHGTK